MSWQLEENEQERAQQSPEPLNTDVQEKVNPPSGSNSKDIVLGLDENNFQAAVREVKCLGSRVRRRKTKLLLMVCPAPFTAPE